MFFEFIRQFRPHLDSRPPASASRFFCWSRRRSTGGDPADDLPASRLPALRVGGVLFLLALLSACATAPDTPAPEPPPEDLGAPPVSISAVAGVERVEVVGLRLGIEGAGTYALRLRAVGPGGARPLVLVRRPWDPRPGSPGAGSDTSAGVRFELFEPDAQPKAFGLAIGVDTRNPDRPRLVLREERGGHALRLEASADEDSVRESYEVDGRSIHLAYGRESVAALRNRRWKGSLDDPAVTEVARRFDRWYRPPAELSGGFEGAILGRLLSDEPWLDWLTVTLDEKGFQAEGRSSLQKGKSRTTEIACSIAGLTAVLKCPFGGPANVLCVRALATTIVCIFLMV